MQILPPLPWIAVLAAAAILAYQAGGARLAALAGACFLYLAAFGQWQSAMITLSSIVIAVPFGVVGGILLGIAGFRAPRFRRVLVPILDGMQTIPVFAYLLPILFLFGFGPISALVATIIYAMPPMVRVTMLALDNVQPEIVEFGRMAGCTKRQLIAPGDDAGRPRAADGRRQPGDHALAQHGDHRLDDRRRRARLRRAALASKPRHRRRA